MKITRLQQPIDPWLTLSVTSLMALGIVMLTSASLPVAERLSLPLFYFATHQVIYIAIGLGCMLITSYIPLNFHIMRANYYLLLAVLLLMMVLIPGVGKTLNGSQRWLFIGPISIQPSELAKLCYIFYLASYLVRRADKKTNWQGFFIPMGVLGLIVFLLLLEPDFGAAVVIISMALGTLFLAGVPLRRFLVLVPVIAVGLVIIGFTASYRLQRLIAFQNPWADQFNSGYQLVQSLIAFGRGGWFGSGLGGSVQKLLYLPEAHTDFLFAVIAEELGLFGALLVVIIFSLFVYRVLLIGRKAVKAGLSFQGNLAYAIGLWVCLQAIINLGVNVGMLPTKGITLPFMSAGGSSMIVACIALGIIYRVDYETRVAMVKVRKRC